MRARATRPRARAGRRVGRPCGGPRTFEALASIGVRSFPRSRAVGPVRLGSVGELRFSPLRRRNSQSSWLGWQRRRRPSVTSPETRKFAASGPRVKPRKITTGLAAVGQEIAISTSILRLPARGPTRRRSSGREHPVSPRRRPTAVRRGDVGVGVAGSARASRAAAASRRWPPGPARRTYDPPGRMACARAFGRSRGT